MPRRCHIDAVARAGGGYPVEHDVTISIVNFF
jgi:hypothetical protein